MSRAGVAGGNNQIWAVEPDGTRLRRVTTTTDATNWSWVSVAPDGRLLAADTSNNVWILSASGVPVLQLTNIPAAPDAGFVQGDWSPDMTQVVIATGSTSPGRVTVVNADNSGYTVFAGAVVSLVVNGKLCWSPDGTKIAFPTGGTGGSVYVSVATCDATSGGSVTTVLAAVVGSTSYVPYAWYGDSTNLLVAELASPNDARLLQSDGTTTTTLYDDPGQTVLGGNSGSVVALSPDELQVAWTNVSGEGLAVLDAGATHAVLPGVGAMDTVGISWGPVSPPRPAVWIA